MTANTATKPFTYKVAPASTVTKPFTYTVAPVPQSTTKPFTYTVTVAGPTVVAGPGRAVDAGEVFALTPQSEQAGAASITGRLWTQGGATVGTTASVVIGAPITRDGVTLTYTYSATDANGNTSPTSSLVVTVRPASIRGPGGVPLAERVA